MFKLKPSHWFNLDHEMVNKKFSGNPKYLREWEINGHTWAVYFCDSPDRGLNHKDYMMLGKAGQQWYVSGRDKTDMQKHRYQEAALCTVCNTVIYSCNNHDCNSCPCGKTSIDGGSSYTRLLGSNWKILTLDLLTGTSFDPITGEIYTYDK